MSSPTFAEIARSTTFVRQNGMMVVPAHMNWGQWTATVEVIEEYMRPGDVYLTTGNPDPATVVDVTSECVTWKYRGAHFTDTRHQFAVGVCGV